MTIAEVFPNLKELQDIFKHLISHLIHSHDEPHGINFKKLNSIQCFLNCVQTYENIWNMYAISHIKNISKTSPTAENFLNHTC